METINYADLTRKQENKVETFMVWIYKEAERTGELYKKIEGTHSKREARIIQRAIVKDFFDIYFTQIPDFTSKVLQRRIAYNCNALARGKGFESGYDHFVEKKKNLGLIQGDSIKDIDNYFENHCYFGCKGWIK
tara:strand:+ start:6521 stop:6922 length:402 start_codon:yes stop_codon:yes gene_type:complete